jgi:hypothetical protein
MPAANSPPPDISICIPTRNRATLLNRCLSHLMTFSSFNFEVVIADNASTDDTKDIVSLYAEKFPHLTYLRHDTDIGFIRNIHSVLGRARARYAYVLCDDDIVFESGLVLLKTALDESPELAAASGNYVGTNVAPTVGTNISYRDKKYFRIARGNYLALADNFLLCDGFPLLRTEMFRRYCIYHERGFGLVPLFAQLLAHGDILFVDQPIFQHFQNRESLSMQLPEPWFHDASDADLETAFANVPEPLPTGKLQQLREQYHRITYIQSARMCRIRRDFPLMWHFLLRAKSVGGVTENLLVQCERTFLLDVISQRLCRMIEDGGTKSVMVENTPLLLALKARLQELLPAVEFSAAGNNADAAVSGVNLVEKFAPDKLAAGDSPTVIAFYDLLTALRLTRHAVEAITDGDAIKIAVSAPHGPDAGFALLMGEYGQPASGETPAADPMANEAAQTPPAQLDTMSGRNRPCSCGSGKKYKHCHGRYA